MIEFALLLELELGLVDRLHVRGQLVYGLLVFAACEGYGLLHVVLLTVDFLLEVGDLLAQSFGYFNLE